MKKRIAIILGLVVGIPIIGYVLLCVFLPVDPRFNTLPRVENTDIVRVQIGVRDKEPIFIENQDQITRLVSLINSSRGTAYHFCGFHGTFTFFHPDGSKSWVSFVPGHSDDIYELVATSFDSQGQPSINGYSQVDRKEFFEIMNEFGIDSKDLLREH